MPVCIPKVSSMEEIAKERSPYSKVRVVATAFTASGHQVARATNKAVFGEKNVYSIHAEDMLITKLRKIKAKERFGKIFVLVVRWSRREGRWTMAKPCRNCQTILNEYGVAEIYYSNKDGDIIRLKD